MVENYPITLKNINLLHNKITSKIASRIEAILQDTPPSSERDNKESLKFNINEKYQLDEYIKDAQGMKNKSDDNKTHLKPITKKSITKPNPFNKDFIKKNYAKIKSDINYDDEDSDLLQPVDDLRYKNHFVMPFNLNK